MKASDVIAQLQLKLPQYTDKFTRNFDVSLSTSGTTVTATCVDQGHLLKTGGAVAFTGAYTPITIVSISRSGTIATCTTASSHDFTTGVSTDVIITGTSESVFNDTFTFLARTSSTSFTFTVADSGATSATGGSLLNGSSYLRSYNKTFQVTNVLSPTVFQFEHTVSGLPSPTGTIECRSKPRVSGAVSYDAALAAYTSQNDADLWAFVVIADEVASNNRYINNDGVANIQSTNVVREQTIQNFSVLVFFPTSSEIAARQSRDIADDVKLYLSNCLLGRKFPSGWAQTAQFGVSFVRAAFLGYDKAYYVHEYEFQQIGVICSQSTSFQDHEDVALENICLDIYPDIQGDTTVDPVQLSIDLPGS